jgi:uncharacterized protein YlxW (UPF0749 family)
MNEAMYEHLRSETCSDYCNLLEEVCNERDALQDRVEQLEKELNAARLTTSYYMRKVNELVKLANRT